MTHMFIDHLDNAYQSIRSNRTRSLLTTLGIAIGIASVTCILAISNGVSHMIGAQVDGFNGNLIVVRPLVQTHDPNLYTSPVAQQSFNTSSLSEQDITSLRATTHISAVAPLTVLGGTLQSATGSVKQAVVLATTEEFAKTTQLDMKAGQFVTNEADSKMAVVGEQLAIDLFGTDKPIGQQFTISGQTYVVGGVIRSDSHPVNYNGVDLKNAAVIPFASGKQIRSNAQIQQINVLLDTSSNGTNIVKTALQKNHHDEQDFTILAGSEIARPSSELFRSLADVMTVIAAISLFVGGIGVMNIMLVGVAERTREVGIRKAVGASNSTIVVQFLIESLMISLAGGMIGYLTGYVLAFGISTVLYFTPSLTWITLAAALGMAIVVGIGFGLYPAIKASRKDTIQSLRQYH